MIPANTRVIRAALSAQAPCRDRGGGRHSRHNARSCCMACTAAVGTRKPPASQGRAVVTKQIF